MHFSHVGWVPCISGHLDFGLMKPGIIGGFTNNQFSDERTTCINYSHTRQKDYHARRIILQSKVDWRDTIEDHYDGRFRVIVSCTAKESHNLDQRSLSGDLYIYRINCEEQYHKKNNKFFPWFDVIHRMQEDLRQENPNWEELQNTLNNDAAALDLALNDHEIKDHFYKINFQVESNGLVKLGISSDSNSIPDEYKYLAIRQAYYYVKYSLHSHKHHFQQEDSLTTVVEIDDLTQKEIGLKLLGQLKRELSNIKRTYANGGNTSSCDEQGVIAYMYSFIESLYQSDYLCEKLYTREKLYLDAVRDSFNVQTNKLDKKESSIENIKAKYRSYVTIALSILSLIWIIVFKDLSEHTAKKFSNPLNLLEHILIIGAIFVSSAYIYCKQVQNRINSLLDEKGFRTWLEAHYLVEEKKYKKEFKKQIIKNTLVFLSSMLVILVLYCLLTLDKKHQQDWLDANLQSIGLGNYD